MKIYTGGYGDLRRTLIALRAVFNEFAFSWEADALIELSVRL
jgi:hypothetical protein